VKVKAGAHKETEQTVIKAYFNDEVTNYF